MAKLRIMYWNFIHCTMQPNCDAYNTYLVLQFTRTCTLLQQFTFALSRRNRRPLLADQLAQCSQCLHGCSNGQGPRVNARQACQQPAQRRRVPQHSPALLANGPCGRHCAVDVVTCQRPECTSGAALVESIAARPLAARALHPLYAVATTR